LIQEVGELQAQEERHPAEVDGLWER
jgi:hypothetical protein